jgi:hypothetical protein
MVYSGKYCWRVAAPVANTGPIGSLKNMTVVTPSFLKRAVPAMDCSPARVVSDA